MTTAQMLGTAATLYGFGACFAMLLQTRQLRARGSSCDVSATFLGTYVGGYAVWLLYGVSIGSLPIILVHARRPRLRRAHTVRGVDPQAE